MFGEGSKDRDVLLVRVSSTFTNGFVFVVEFAVGLYLSLAGEEQHTHA